jgi:threonine/homoserine/homoserine lactone efflux protein
MVLTEDLSAFIIAGIALAGSPGPATLSLAAAHGSWWARRSRDGSVTPSRTGFST